MIDAKTRVLAVIGNPVGHSLSPAMHNVALKELGLNYVYLAFNVENVGIAIQAMRELGFRGYSVTIPHKETVIKFLDKVDGLAEKIGAVNTVANDNGCLVGYNTDAMAAVGSLLKKVSLKEKRVSLLGAGGVARAAAFALKQEGALSTIFDISPEKARALAKSVGCNCLPLKELSGLRGDILVNATPVGMFPNVDKSPVEEQILDNYSLVFDVVYNPVETKLLKQAKKAGCETVSGFEMFVGQGVEQLRLWTGKEPPTKLMQETVLGVLEKKT